ncbi:MAG: hypothetical protein GYB32_10080 [Algicola sp.]|nr:hypothetical protein [Algicola sp.]
MTLFWLALLGSRQFQISQVINKDYFVVSVGLTADGDLIATEGIHDTYG